MEYEFTLTYQLGKNDCNLNELVERFGACGCTDALIGIGQAGRIGLKFTREATTAKDAIKSAMVSIRKVVPTAKLVEASPDYVGLTDAAEVLGMTRQNLRKLMLSSVSFPPPVHEGSSGLWHLSDLLKWLQEKDYLVADSVIEVSITTRHINVTKEMLQLSAETQLEMAELLP